MKHNYLLKWLKTKYEAHSDCIYQILIKNNKNELVSTSEDGSVKTWGKYILNIHFLQPIYRICSRTVPFLNQMLEVTKS